MTGSFVYGEQVTVTVGGYYPLWPSKLSHTYFPSGCRGYVVAFAYGDAVVVSVDGVGRVIVPAAALQGVVTA